LEAFGNTKYSLEGKTALIGIGLHLLFYPDSVSEAMCSYWAFLEDGVRMAQRAWRSVERDKLVEFSFRHKTGKLASFQGVMWANSSSLPVSLPCTPVFKVLSH
jgi:hypothetical protein